MNYFQESEQLAKLRAMVEAKKLDEKSPLPLDDFMLRRFIIVKKTADKAFHTLKNYVVRVCPISEIWRDEKIPLPFGRRFVRLASLSVLRFFVIGLL